MMIADAVRRAPLLLIALLASQAPAQPARTPMALSALEPGLWQLLAPDRPPRDVCVSNPTALVQLRHGGSACSRLVISNERNSATVHYSCPGAGWGRTTVRVATPRAATIDSQGIADNAPFAFTIQARRIGECGTRRTSLTR